MASCNVTTGPCEFTKGPHGRTSSGRLFWCILFFSSLPLWAAGNVVLFEHADFRGRSEIVNEDRDNLKGSVVGNDRVSSIRVPRGFKVTLYADSGYRGKFVVLYDDVRDLGRTGLGNDRASSVRVERVDGRPEPVIFYTLPNFRGKSERFYEGRTNMRDTFLGNDSVSSVRIPRGMSVTIYRDKDYGGESVVLYDDVANLVRTSVGNKKMSSFHIDTGRKPIRDRFDKVVLFDDTGYSGRREVLAFDDPDLNDNTIGNDRLRSLRVPPGHVVVLYEHSHYRGRSEEFHASDPNLSDNVVGLDRASSIRILHEDEVYPEPIEEVVDGVELFEHSRFRGNRTIAYDDIPDLRATEVGNDQLSSVRIPRGFRVLLYPHVNYGGRPLTLTHSDDDLSGSRVGNDRVSSIRVERLGGVRGGAVIDRPGPPPAATGVILFSKPNFQGFEAIVHGDVDDLSKHVFGNDKLSSIKVPRGYRVTLFKHSHFRGKSEVFESNDRNLRNNHIGVNEASSIRIEWIGK